jgi:signal transduction histidine kinase
MEFPPDFPEIEADADKLDQILTNLVDNAIKYSPQGGNVRVTGKVIGPESDQIWVQISDEGIGVSKEHLPKLFHNFYRVDNRDNREIGGTGIGLALVKSLVEKHHGYVTMDSELGRGSEVTIVLPIRQPETGQEGGSPDPAGQKD